MKTQKELKSSSVFHSVGETVIVRNSEDGHYFKIGQKVKITSKDNSGYLCAPLTGNGKSWWISDYGLMTNKELSEYPNPSLS